MKRLALLALLTLAACGADGDPFVPTGSVGASFGPGGVETSASAGVTNGTITVGLSL
jgi:hypothetical protein